MREMKLRVLIYFGLVVLLCIALPIRLTTHAQNANSYQPPAASLPVLGNIARLLHHATPVDQKPFAAHPATFIGVLPGGALYFEVSTIDVDDDGDSAGSPAGWASHPLRNGKIDKSHQNEVSYTTKVPISPFSVPYIVLPGSHSIKPHLALPCGDDQVPTAVVPGGPKSPSTWWAKQKISIGDGAVVIRGDKRIDAVFADSGPCEKVGEMSLKAHQLFGETVFVPGKKAQLGPDGSPLKDATTGAIVSGPALVTRNSASKGPFIVIVFPGTSAGAKFVSIDQSLQSVIDQRFAALVAGSADSLK